MARASLIPKYQSSRAQAMAAAKAKALSVAKPAGASVAKPTKPAVPTTRKPGASRGGRKAGGVNIGIGGSALARETGFKQPYVSLLLKQGFSPESIRERAIKRQQKQGIANPGTATAATHRFGPGRVAKKINGEDFASAQTRKEIAMADAREMQNAIQAGSLVSRAQMADWFAAGIVQAKDVLLKLEELGDVFAQELDPAVIRTTLRTEVTAALARLEEAYRVSAEQAIEPDEADDQVIEKAS